MSADNLNDEQMLEEGLQRIRRYLEDLLAEPDSEREPEPSRDVEPYAFTGRYASYESHTCWSRENSIFDEPLLAVPEMDQLQNWLPQKVPVQPAYWWIPVCCCWYPCACAPVLVFDHYSYSSMHPWWAAGRAAEFAEVRARYSPEVVERAYGAWAALGFNNDFRQVAAYYDRLHALEETFTAEARAASRAADAHLRGAPPPVSECLRRLYPHLYPHCAPAPPLPPAPPLLTDWDAAAHFDVRRYLRDHGVTMDDLLAEFREHAARERLPADHRQLLRYVNSPAAPRPPALAAPESSTAAAGDRMSLSVAVTCVTSKTVYGTPRGTRCTISTSRNVSAMYSFLETSEDEPGPSSRTREVVPANSNFGERSKPETSRANSRSEFVPSEVRRSVVSASVSLSGSSVAASDTKRVIYAAVQTAAATIASSDAPPAIAGPADFKRTTSTSASRVNMMPEWYRQPTAAGMFRPMLDVPTRPGFSDTPPPSLRRNTDVASRARPHRGEAAPSNLRFANAIPFDSPRRAEAPFDPHRSMSRAAHGPLRSEEPGDAAPTPVRSPYRAAVLGGLSRDANDPKRPRRRLDTATSLRSSFDASGSPFSYSDAAASPKSSQSSRSNLDSSVHSPGHATGARRSLEPSTGAAGHEEARRRPTEAEAPRPHRPYSFGGPQYHRPIDERFPNETRDENPDRGNKRTKPRRVDLTGGGSREHAKVDVSGGAGAEGASSRGGADAGAPGDVSSTGSAGGARSGPSRSSDTTNIIADEFNKLSVDKD